MNTRINLGKLFMELASLEGNYYKSRAYSNAANIVFNQITDEEFNTSDDFTSYYGIGSGINGKIIEYRETGTINKLEELRKENSDYLDPNLYKVRKSFITKRITYEEASKFVDELADLNFKFIVAGSYRRKKELIGDIDILVSSNDYDEYVSILSGKYDLISSGDSKSSFMIDQVNKIQLDIISCSHGTEVFQLLYLTGSKEFNIRMRAKAKSFGYLLNQNGLWDENYDPVMSKSVDGKYNTENEVFDVLEMDYVKPENR